MTLFISVCKAYLFSIIHQKQTRNLLWHYLFLDWPQNTGCTAHKTLFWKDLFVFVIRAAGQVEPLNELVSVRACVSEVFQNKTPPEFQGNKFSIYIFDVQYKFRGIRWGEIKTFLLNSFWENIWPNIAFFPIRHEIQIPDCLVWWIYSSTINENWFFFIQNYCFDNGNGGWL